MVCAMPRRLPIKAVSKHETLGAGGISPSSPLLTAAAYQGLSRVPPELEWFANLGNAATRRAYQTALANFMRFANIQAPEEFRTVTRAHVIAWRDDLVRRALSATTIRHRLSALGPCLAVRLPLRPERRHPQPGQGREAAGAGDH